LRRKLNNFSEDGWTENPGYAGNKASNFNFFFQTNHPQVITPEKHLYGTITHKNTDMTWNAKQRLEYHADNYVDASGQYDEGNKQAPKILKNRKLEITAHPLL
jgi:hypothetical protein